MSITTLSDWGKVELAAQTHELNHVESPKVPEPTIGQQLAWATVRCAQLQTSLHRKDRALAECRMWLSVGDTQRAQEVLNRGLMDL